MKYTLNTYAGAVEVDIPDGTTEVAGIDVSGDEVLIWPVFRDTAWASRIEDHVGEPFYKVLVDGKWVKKENEIW